MKIVRKTHLVQMYFAALVMAIAGLLAPVVWASEIQSMGYDLSSTELMAQQSNGVVIVDMRRNEEWKDPGIIDGAETITALKKSRFIASRFSGEICVFGSKPKHTVRFVLQVWSTHRNTA